MKNVACFFAINTIKQLTTVSNCYILFVEGRKSVLPIRQGGVDMNIIINNSSMIPVYEQLVGQIKQEILDGELTEGAMLPSVRHLSAELRISALTVKKAYDRLEEEGFVNTVHGKGTFVTATNRQLAVEARRRAVEEDFSVAVQRAKLLGLEDGEIREIVEIFLSEAP